MLLLYIAANETNNMDDSVISTTPNGFVSYGGKPNYAYKSLKLMQNDNNLNSGVYIFSANKSFPMGFL